MLNRDILFDASVSHTLPMQRHCADSLVASVTGLSVDLHPLHDLFECNHTAYLAKPRATDRFNIDAYQSQMLFVFNAARQFFACRKQGHLCIAMPTHTLMKHDLIAALHTFMNQHPMLHDRLVLLCQPDHAYPTLNNDTEIHLLAQRLSAMGIRLGIDIPGNCPAWANTGSLDLLSPYILIRHTGSMGDLTYMCELASVIKNCRRKKWPLLADYQQTDSGVIQ